MRTSWWLVCAAGVALSVAYLVVPGSFGDADAARVLYLAVGALGTGATVAGLLRHRPRRAAGWWCVLLSQVVWLAGAVVDAAITWTGSAAPFPTAADGLYGAGSAPLVVGLLLMSRRARQDSAHAGRLDAAIVAVGLALLGCTLLGPLLAEDEHGLARWTAVTFLVSDVLLAAVLAHLVAVSPRVTASFRLCVTAALLLLASDTSYAWGGSGPLGDAVLVVGWSLSITAWGAAAIHPSMRSVTERHLAGPEDLDRRRTAVMLVAILLPAVVLGGQVSRDVAREMWPAIAASALMSVLVVTRMGLALRVARVASAERERMHAVVQHQATHDALTGLANRAHVLDRLRTALRTAPARESGVGLLFLDLDGFKAVNDSHGHRAGDEVLRVVAERLTAAVRPGDCAGRLGGDEFVVVLGDVPGPEVALAVGQLLVALLSEPIGAGGRQVTIGASVGAATGGARTDPDQMLHDADTAAYRSKGEGGHQVHLHPHRAPSGGASSRR